MTEDSEPENDWSNYESGPYCAHWSEPWDCNETCACGHACTAHATWEDGCNEDGCGCPRFTAPDDAQPISQRAVNEVEP